MSKTILIVEDHNATRTALRRWLAEVWPQHLILEAASGEEAITIVGASTPHLVLMDVTLPQMNGIETIQHVRAKVPTSQVVILTIHEEDAYRADAMTAGASAFIPKRTMQTELIPTLSALLSGADEGK